MTAPRPDLDLLEYVLVSAPTVEGLAPVAAAVAGLVGDGALRLLDAVVLLRPAGSASVRSAAPGPDGPLAVLHPVLDGRVQLSAHDVGLASLTLEQDEAALLLLVENRWADALASAVRQGGARLAAGEWIARERAAAGADLLVRGPGTRPTIDQVAQVRDLARLVDRGVLPLERYDVQRLRVLEG